MEHQLAKINPIISESWLELQPLEYPANPRRFENYLEHIRRDFGYENIPDQVLEQWIYLHHNNPVMIREYAWIDFRAVQFALEKWTVEELHNLKTIQVFKGMISPIDDRLKVVEASGKEKECWDEQGTWLTPPIIQDVNSFRNRPPYAEQNSPFQLVEGHSRMRNLLISTCQGLNLSPLHDVYRMINCKLL